MENGLIIGRNYENEKKTLTINSDTGEPYKDGEIGQQSEKIWDGGVSRRHLRLTRVGKSNYHIELLNLNNKLYIDGKPVVSKDINGYEKVELGKNFFHLNLRQAIRDLENKTNKNSADKTELPDSSKAIGPSNNNDGDSIGTPSPSGKSIGKPQFLSPIVIDVDALFKLVNIVTIVLLVLAIVLKKNYPIAQSIVLIALAVVIACNIYLYSQKKQIKK